MKLIDIELDLFYVHSLIDLHKVLIKVFGFLNFNELNENTLTDCLSDLRVKGDNKTTMCNVYIEPNEILAITVKNLSIKNKFIISELILTIEEVNRRSMDVFNVPSIYLICL